MTAEALLRKKIGAECVRCGQEMTVDESKISRLPDGRLVWIHSDQQKCVGT